MPDVTSKLGIKKPLGNEYVTRQSFNENWDTVDQNAASQTELDTHKADQTMHITEEERTTWNEKETPTGAQQKADTALTDAKEYANIVETNVKNYADSVGVDAKNYADSAATTAEANAKTDSVSKDAVYNQNNPIDPNTTVFPYILTNHINGPQANINWYIRTYFNGASSNNNKAQIAIRYHGSGNEMYMRHYYNNWTNWTKFLTEQDTAASLSIEDINNNFQAGHIEGALKELYEKWGVWSGGINPRDLLCYGKRAFVGYNDTDGDRLVINFLDDFSNGVTIFGGVNLKKGLTWNDGADSLDDLKTSVSDGKSKIATAITDAGGTASGSDTFQELADAITNDLSSGGVIGFGDSFTDEGLALINGDFDFLKENISDLVFNCNLSYNGVYTTPFFNLKESMYMLFMYLSTDEKLSKSFECLSEVLDESDNLVHSDTGDFDNISKTFSFYLNKNLPRGKYKIRIKGDSTQNTIAKLDSFYISRIRGTRVVQKEKLID
ncbi:pyocin knob domain-containing protein [Longirhabdus pacifica]|uniref:pyocin knob domain-containing protein n=1 Tax=Longirhabdus pacifica TaxID=2305227 RepID=UPI001008EC5D|nr:pyocin knob domain-containing protein [Longirhabdus pacifica]